MEESRQQSELSRSEVSQEAVEELTESGVISTEEQDKYQKYTKLSQFNTQSDSESIFKKASYKLKTTFQNTYNRITTTLGKQYTKTRNQTYAEISSVDPSYNGQEITLTISRTGDKFSYTFIDGSPILSNLLEYYNVDNPVQLEEKSIPTTISNNEPVFPSSVSISGKMAYTLFSKLRLIEQVRKIISDIIIRFYPLVMGVVIGVMISTVVFNSIIHELSPSQTAQLSQDFTTVTGISIDLVVQILGLSSVGIVSILSLLIGVTSLNAIIKHTLHIKNI